MLQSSQRLLLTILVATATVPAGARNFRDNADRLPNGSVNSCSNCHTDPGGGGDLTPFGEDVFVKIGGSSLNIPFWDAGLAALDSDGDGFSNGEELGDPDGDLQNLGPASAVSLPGDSNSTPPPSNTAPGFTSSPVTSAFIGESYSYQATAFDSEGHSLTFSKANGPEWLTVSAAGLVSGTPTDGSAGSPSVSIKVTDNGSPNLSNTQDYTLTVSASFTGFQNANFTLPGEAAIAAADQDPDEDNLPNIAEYALKTNPRSADLISVPGTPTFDSSDRMEFVLQVRDDDPNLVIQLEVSTEIPFSSPTNVEPAVTDPNGSDGLETWTFTDPISKGSIMSRFGQLKFQLSQ